MVDPRIYRTGLAVVLLAVIVFAFSFENQQGALSTHLVPDAFNGGDAYTSMRTLAAAYPDREPGSTGDEDLATAVRRQFRRSHFTVATQTFEASTAAGSRTLETVTGTRVGRMNGMIVVVAHRDATGSPATSELSGTAVLLQLARVLAGETQNRSLMLVSTSGSVGAAGATRLARSLAGEPVDAVIVLGDLAASRATEPIVVPWSNGHALAPPLLRNTLSDAVGRQSGLKAGATSVGGQIAHLAFPLTLSEQGPFGAERIPAVLLSLSSDRAPSAQEPVSQTSITSMGRAVLETINALDAGPAVPAPSAYLLISGKLVPLWAVQLLVLGLILPVIVSTIDGLARARRRGHGIIRWLVWVLAGAVPFAVALGLGLVVRFTGLLSAAPPGPVGEGGVPLHADGVGVIAVLALAVVVSFFALRPLCIRRARQIAGRRPVLSESPAGDGAAVALMIVVCACALAVWALNPFAAALVVPALHLWLWMTDSRVRSRRVLMGALIVGGMLAPALVVAYYANTLGLGPIDIVWGGVLLIAGGHLGIASGLLWSVLLGCAASAVVIAVRGSRERPGEEPVVTVRGPVTYAGPGSLGGTDSALRARR